MIDSLWGVFTFFVTLFVVILYYWYIAVPLVLFAVWGCIKTRNKSMKRIYRIFFAFILLSAIAMFVQYFIIGNM